MNSAINYAIEILKPAEGLHLEPYLCPAGVPSIGWGTTLYPPVSAWEISRVKVKLTDRATNEREAKRFLAHDMSQCNMILVRTIPHWDEMHPKMQGALLDFAYNLGAHFYDADGFRSITAALKSPTSWPAVPRILGLYVKDGNGDTLQGLVKRRKAEGDLWSEGLAELNSNPPESPMSGTSFEDFKNTYVHYKGEPHQIDALNFAYDTLKETGDLGQYFQLYRTPQAPPLSNPLNVSYFSQRDNPGANGDVECFASSCAMAAMFHGAITSENEYLYHFPRYGASTDPNVHIRTLQYFGLQARFRTDGDRDALVKLIDEGCPVPCGWLHHGHVSSPSGGGHYGCVIGYTSTGFVVHDPFGDPNLVVGGWDKTNSVNPGGSVYGKSLTFSSQCWIPRWCVEGGASGWYMEIRKP